MIEQDKDKFSKIMAVLGKVFSPIDAQLQKTYFKYLGDLSIERVEKAANKWILTGKFFPKISEIRELAIEENKVTAAEAWNEVISAIRAGHYENNGKNVTWSSEAVKIAANSVGGLYQIWIEGTEQEKFTRERFCRNYKELSECDRHNKLIGEPTRDEAKQILANLQKRIGV